MRTSLSECSDILGINFYNPLLWAMEVTHQFFGVDWIPALLLFAVPIRTYATFKRLTTTATMQKSIFEFEMSQSISKFQNSIGAYIQRSDHLAHLGK
jgi:hypothetical protein